MHNGTKTLSITNVCVCVCVGGVWGHCRGWGLEGGREAARGPCALNVLGDAKIQSGPLEAKDKRWVGGRSLSHWSRNKNWACWDVNGEAVY